MSHHRFALRALLPLVLIAAACWSPVVHAAGVIQFLEPRMNVREGETHEITVIRSGSSSGEVTVVLNVSLGGTATLGEDYTIDLPLGVVQIPDGALFGRASLEVLQDTRVEGTEFAVFTLANPTGATLARDNSLLLQIEDDEEADATFGIAGNAVQRVEAGGELPITVTRSGRLADTLSVVLLGVPNTAALGIDYSDLTTTLEFGPQETSAAATLSTIAPAEPGPPRTLSLLLAAPTPPGGAAFAGTGPLVVIEDAPGDRAGEFSLFTSTTGVDEVDGSIVFTVDRNRGSVGTASVSWTTVDGAEENDAVAGVDYVGATGTLTFAAGETRKTFEVALIEGESVRPQRRFEVVLANPTDSAGLDPEGRRVTVTVRADPGIPGEDCTGLCDCFIATAAWGSWMDPHVATLRGFRDDVLMPNAAGRAFVAFYYQHSPPLAEFIAAREYLRVATRMALAPLVFAIERPSTAGGLLLAGFVLLVNLRRRRARNALP